MKRSRRVQLSSSFLALGAMLAASVAGCSSEPDQALYCGDEDRYVLEAEECEDDDDIGFIYIGQYGGYQSGQRLPDLGPGATRVRASDSAARAKAGLPARGGFGGNGKAFSIGG